MCTILKNFEPFINVWALGLFLLTMINLKLAWLNSYVYIHYKHVLCVCFITQSFLTHYFFLSNLSLPTIWMPWQATWVQSHPESTELSVSYSHRRSPGICHRFLSRSNCSHWSFEATVLINPSFYTDQCEPIIMYYSAALLVGLILCKPSGGWNYLSLPKLQRDSRWSLGMDT